MKLTTHLIPAFLLIQVTLSAQCLEKLVANGAPSFKENKGQISDQFHHPRPDILFSGNAGNLAFYLKNDGLSYQLTRVDTWTKPNKGLKRPVMKVEENLVPAQCTSYRLDISWPGANNAPQILRGEALPGYDNYYLESCPEGALGVHNYTSLLYRSVYPGIDLKWYEKDGNLKYDYYVAAKADYKKIQLEYKGAEKIYVENGELVVVTPLGIIKEQKPLVLQNNKVLKASWIVKGSIVSLEIKNPDPSSPLIIDPMIRLWGTYYGGSKAEEAHYTYADAAGNVFLSGATLSATNIATTGAHQTVFGAGFSGNNDAYLVKFNSAGVRQWATYYGGTGDDYGGECASDAGGNAYLTGLTTTSNSAVMATPGAHQGVYTAPASNSGDAFLVKFDAAGVRQWGTYYGGDKEEYGLGLSVDNSNNVYISGSASSTNNISTSGSHQVNLAGNMDAFLVKFNSSGVRQWGTYYGGNEKPIIDEAAYDCITDASGDTYISGITSSTNGISTPGSHQPVFGGAASSDAFLAKFNPAGVLQWGTYYGGTGNEFGAGMALDASGNLYCAGDCNMGTGTVITTPGSYQPSINGGYDAFLLKFDPSGSRIWATFYGGQGDEYGFTTSVDPSGNVYLSGNTASSGTVSTNMLATPCAYQPKYGGGSSDAFLVKFTPAGMRIWGTFYGSIYSDNGGCCSADAAGNIYLCGTTLANSGTVMASSTGYQPIGAGAADGYLAKFDGCIPGSPIHSMPPSAMIICSGNSATLNTSCGNWYNTATGTLALSTGDTFITGPLFSDTTLYVEDFACGSVFGTRTAINVTVVPVPSLTITNNNPSACFGEPIVLTASGASTYSWASPASASASIQVYVALYQTFSVTGTSIHGCTSAATIGVTTDLCLGVKENILNKGVTVLPNPGDGTLEVHAFSERDLVLVNELGQQVRAAHLDATNHFSTSWHDLPEGVYFLKDEKGDTCQKIIVIH